MALPSGLSTQLGSKDETTYGTYAVPDRFHEYVTEGLELAEEEIESTALRAGDQTLREDRRVANRKGAGGPLAFEVANKSFGLWLNRWFGNGVITTPAGGILSRDHTFTVADLGPLSFTTQIGKPDLAGTVQPFSYLGCKVVEAELIQELDAILMFNASLDAQNEVTNQTLAVASFPAALQLFHHGQCAIEVAAGAFDSTKFSFKMTTGIKTDRYFLRNSTLKKSPVHNARRQLTGELMGEFESLTAYNRFVNKTIVEIKATWTGALIEGVLNYMIELTLPKCRFDGTTPKVGGPDVLEQPLPFTVLKPTAGTAEATLVYRTIDTVS